MEKTTGAMSNLVAPVRFKNLKSIEFYKIFHLSGQSAIGHIMETLVELM